MKKRIRTKTIPDYTQNSCYLSSHNKHAYYALKYLLRKTGVLDQEMLMMLIRQINNRHMRKFSNNVFSENLILDITYNLSFNTNIYDETMYDLTKVDENVCKAYKNSIDAICREHWLWLRLRKFLQKCRKRG